jgi:hypothetical protein
MTHPTHPFLLFHYFDRTTTIEQQEIACDSSWYKRSHEQRRLALPFPSIQRKWCERCNQGAEATVPNERILVGS